MFTHIHRNKGFSYEVSKHFSAQVVMAFEYLVGVCVRGCIQRWTDRMAQHNLDIVYRDLKPENLLIDCHGNVRVTGESSVAAHTRASLALSLDLCRPVTFSC
jgi:serine/threonine protein kinase